MYQQETLNVSFIERSFLGGLTVCVLKYLPRFVHSFSIPTELLLFRHGGNLGSLLHGLGPVDEVQVEIVQLQVLQRCLTRRYDIFLGMTVVPEKINFFFEHGAAFPSLGLKTYHSFDVMKSSSLLTTPSSKHFFRATPISTSLP